jgi:cation transport ATPase
MWKRWEKPTIPAKQQRKETKSKAKKLQGRKAKVDVKEDRRKKVLSKMSKSNPLTQTKGKKRRKVRKKLLQKKERQTEKSSECLTLSLSLSLSVCVVFHLVSCFFVSMPRWPRVTHHSICQLILHSLPLFFFFFFLFFFFFKFKLVFNFYCFHSHFINLHVYLFNYPF